MNILNIEGIIMAKADKIERLTYTVDEVAGILKISQREVFERIHNKQLRAFKMGKNQLVRIPINAVEDALRVTCRD